MPAAYSQQAQYYHSIFNLSSFFLHYIRDCLYHYFQEHITLIHGLQ